MYLNGTYNLWQLSLGQECWVPFSPPAEKQNLAPDVESAAQEAQKQIGAKLSSKDEMTEKKLHVTHLSVVWFLWRMSYRVLTSLLLEWV